jgi:hypothetical protein
MADAPKTEQKLLPPKQESAGMSLLSNTLAIIGFVILIVIVIWGLIHIAALSTSSFGSWFSSSPKVTVTAPANATSGQAVTISWKTSDTSAGSYSFLYQCEQNFEFTTQAQNGLMNRIPCGASINVGSSTSAMIMPIVAGSSTVSVPVSIVFIPSSGGTHSEGSATISVAPVVQVVQTQPAAQTTVQPSVSQKPATQTTAKPTTKKTTPTYSYATKHASNYNLVAHSASGPADLSVRIIAVGVIDPYSGALINRPPASPSDVVGVEFDIANIGGSSTGTWYFQAQLPIPAPNTYTSVAQISLVPGAHILNTLRFSQAIPGGTFTVIVDPIGQVVESNKTNNQATTVIY